MDDTRDNRRSARRVGRAFAPGTPLTELPETAKGIIEAARRILARDGFAGLTYEAVAGESREYKDSVRYHFSGKMGLIAAVVEASVRDADPAIYKQARREPDVRLRLPAAVDASREVAEADDIWITWELVPHVLRDERLRPRLAELYEWYRENYVAILDLDEDDPRLRTARDCACILIAVLDGLALQKALDPDDIDLDRIFDLWLRILTLSLDEVLFQEGPAD